MRIVITGASGNIGTALLRRLGSENHELVGVSRRVPPDTQPYHGVEWHRIDLGTDPAAAALHDVFSGADAVVHLAWLIQPSHDRQALLRTNQGGTRSVIDAARRADVAHLVHMSSVGTYAAAPGKWVDESWSNAGVATSSYSVDKAACEDMLDEAEGDLVVSRVRPAFVLQPAAASEISRYFIGRLVPVPMLRPGLMRFAPLPRDLAVQFVHADDVADLVSRILVARAPGAFNVASEPSVDRSTWRETFGGVGPSLPMRAVRAAATLSWRAHLQPTDGGWIDLAASVPLMRTDRARDLGWTPAHPADQTLREFVSALSQGRGERGPLLYPRGEKSAAR
ncbi:MAG: NAD-dependent epimerase/dehydratase family protein [Actinomycetota bacterium]|nr:NAD-dependent epimerase/dehydratase family protein [Actinomycetota bacterium]